MLSHVTEKLALDWPDEPCESRASKLDERFLSGANSKPEWRKLQFLVICIRRSPDPGSSLFPPALLMRRPLTSPTSWVLWSRVTPPCQWSRRLWPPTVHPLWRLPGSPAPSFLPSHVGPLPPLSESPTVLHTMAILQAYQADILKEMDEGTGLIPEAMKELRRATDLALRATKHTARTVGRSMAGSVAAERHLWLNLTEIREKEKVFFAGRTHLTIWVVWGRG